MRRHSTLARALIDACGGLPEAATACKDAGRRCSVPVLSTYQNVHVPAAMPADVIAILEAHAGEPIYSSALAGALDLGPLHGSMGDAACDLTEEVLDVQVKARASGKDRPPTPREIAELRRELLEVRQAADVLERTIAGAEAAQGDTRLRAV